MGLFSRLLKRADHYDQYWNTVAPAAQSAGVTVTPTTAEGVSAVYACVSAISESVASLPLDIYRRTEDGRQKAKSHPLYYLLHDSPNENQTALEFRELLQRHLLLRGNGYARITWGGNGRPQALTPMHPDSVAIYRAATTGRLVYEYTPPSGETVRLNADEVLHLRYHSEDGVLGQSPITVSRDTVALSLAERTHGEKAFEQGTKLSGVIETPPGTTKEQATAISQSWASGQSGVSNHSKTAVLPNGAEFKPLSMTLEDAEWIEARRFSVEEVARLFRVPPVLIGDLREANYSNAVELGRYFVSHTLRRHLVCWEQAINKTLINDKQKFYAEHNVEGLLRGDSLNRAEFYHLGIDDGWLGRDEVRELENLPKRELPNEAAPAAEE